jgi:hypothetical protein
MIQSLKADGMLSFFRNSFASVRGNEILCVQSTSPVVVRLDTGGKTSAVTQIAPSFYSLPHDSPGSTNIRQIEAFASTISAHARAFLTPAGFLSTFAKRNSATQNIEFGLFACDSLGRPLRCREGWTQGIPLRVLWPDTLIMAEGGGSSDWKIVWYRLGR